MANTNYNTVTVTTSATKIISANSRIRGWIIYNAGSTAVYYGPDDSITTANTVALTPGATILSSDTANWKGDVYGIVATGTEDIRYWDWRE